MIESAYKRGSNSIVAFRKYVEKLYVAPQATSQSRKGRWVGRYLLVAKKRQLTHHWCPELRVRRFDTERPASRH